MQHNKAALSCQKIVQKVFVSCPEKELCITYHINMANNEVLKPGGIIVAGDTNVGLPPLSEGLFQFTFDVHLGELMDRGVTKVGGCEVRHPEDLHAAVRSLFVNPLSQA